MWLAGTAIELATTDAATLAAADANGQLKVTVTNECGHKLPTGYPEGRRVWVNVKFYNEAAQLLGESGKFNIVITEIGGTVGDIESLPYIEAVRQLVASGQLVVMVNKHVEDVWEV